MKLKEIFTATNSLLDENFPNAEILNWVNAGLNDLAIDVGATFPQLTISDMEAEPVIPAKYHYLLVLYAAAKGKEKDSSVVEAQNFLAQYEQGKKRFVSSYVVPDEYKDTGTTGSAIETDPFPNPYNWVW